MAEIMRADKEYAALRDLPRTPCPDELQRKRLLKAGKFECLVFYNYVDKGDYGHCPNRWQGVLQANDEGLVWYYPLDRSVATLEDACKRVGPAFTNAVKRWEVRQKENTVTQKE
jgi:hypothetical protein